MPSPLPYMNFYCKEWLASSGTRRLSLAARGVYTDLACFQWEDGFIPDDVPQLARMLGVSLSDFRKVWPEVQGQFPVAEEGKRQNQRIANDRDLALDKVSKRSDAGKQGGRPPKANPEPEDPEKKSKEKPNAFQKKSKPKGIPEPEPDKKSEPNGSGADAPATGGSDRAPNHAFDPVARVMGQAHARLGWSLPKAVDIRPELKDGSHVWVLIEDFGEDGAVDLFCFAFETWDKPPTWAAVCRQRHQLDENLSKRRIGLHVVEGGAAPFVPTEIREAR